MTMMFTWNSEQSFFTLASTVHICPQGLRRPEQDAASVSLWNAYNCWSSYRYKNISEPEKAQDRSINMEASLSVPIQFGWKHRGEITGDLVEAFFDLNSCESNIGFLFLWKGHMEDKNYMQLAVGKACQSVERGGGPFGAVIVDSKGDVVCAHHNRVTLHPPDPTAHAEIVCIREACKHLGTFSLEGCTLFTSCQPCSMCLSACMWARIKSIVYGSTREEAAAVGFDDVHIYEQLGEREEDREIQMRQCGDACGEPFEIWAAKAIKVMY